MLRSPLDLAVFAGVPAFADVLQTGRPNILDPETVLFLVREAMERNWLTNDGPLVRMLEERFASFQGVRHCVAVANATVGLQLAAKALEITGEVIMPAFTFIATANAMTWIGLQPVFCDVLPDAHTLDPSSAAAVVTRHTGAILGVHLWGHICDVEVLERLGEEVGVPVFYDAAHATGSSRGSTPVGGFGRMEVFSLHATKSIGGLEGGMVATNDDELAERVRRARSHGFVSEDMVGALGINAKMDEFSAAMALANLAHYERLRAHDQAIHDCYRQGLAGVPGISLSDCRAGDSRCHHYAVVEVSEAASIGRDTLCRILAAENVIARRYFSPGCHRSPPYDGCALRCMLPVTDRLSGSVMQLPTGMQLTCEDATRIAELIAFACMHGGRLEREMANRASVA